MYLEGSTFTEIGKAYRVNRTVASNAFRRAGFKKRLRIVDKIILKGHSYYKDDGYYVRRMPCGKCVRLHREIWKHHNGVLEDEIIVHHIDEDKANNSITNLQAMTPSDHMKHHGMIKSLINESEQKHSKGAA